MKKLNNSNFELLEDIIKELDFQYKQDNQNNLDNLNKYWRELVGKKISAFSKVINFSDKNILTVACSDSFVANELYYEKQNLLEFMNKNMQNLGITIKDIKFNYKKWEEE